MLAFSEFARLAQQGNYVPVTLTLTADLETPVSILSRLKDDEDVFLLESVDAESFPKPQQKRAPSWP